MPLSASLNVGVSALKSFAEGIQVTSNNIANVNTIGYKTSRAQYSDTFSNLLKPLVPNNANTGVKIPPTQIGGGVQIESVTAVFSQGTIQTSSNNSDLAIAGSGFFMVKDVSTGKTMATRAGNFRLDSDGYLVTQQGYRVQGASGAQTRIEYNASLGTIDVKGPQDNISVTAKSLNQELFTVEVPSLTGIGVGDVVSGPGIVYGTKVLSLESKTDSVTNEVTHFVSLDRKPSISTTQPAIQGDLILSTGSPYAQFFDNSKVASFPVGQYLGGIGIVPGTRVSQVNRNSLTNLDGTFASLDGTAIVNASGAAGLNSLQLDPVTMLAQVSTLAVGMRVTDGVGAAGSYITDINASTGVITLSLPLSTLIAAGTSLKFSPTLTLSSSVGETIENIKATGAAVAGVNNKIALSGFSVSAGTSRTIADLSVGMQVISGSGAQGLYMTDIPSGVITLSGDLTQAAAGTYSFGGASPTWVNSDKFPSLSFSNYYKPALTVGDVRVGFELGTDYTLVDTANNELSGLARAEAADLAPRIRTFNVGATGEISVILSNGQTFKAGYVLLQAFKDPGALIREGSNMFSGVDSAGFFNGAFEAENIENLIPGTRGLGAINGGGLELSNVDLGEEFSNMIITQRAFQAGSRVISTTDAMMEEVVNLKR